MGVSVVILTKNSESTIWECLGSVSLNKPDEIIIVDGNSGDGTLDIVREYTNKVYYDEGKGLCYARQLSAEMASEEYVCYVDSDVILEPDTIQALLAELRQNGYGALTARTLIRGGTGYFGWAARRYKNDINPDIPGVKKATIPMRATLIPRELVLKFGFDLSTPSRDDSSISQNLIENGYKIAVSESHVYHIYGADRKHRGAYWVGVALAETFLKHKKSPGLVVKYTFLAGLCSPFMGMVLSVSKGELRLIPSFIYIFSVQATGFTSKLLDVFLGKLKKTGAGEVK